MNEQQAKLSKEIEILGKRDDQLRVQAKELSKTIHAKQNKLNRKRKMIEDLDRRTDNLKKPCNVNSVFSISEKTKVNRKAKPYHRGVSERTKYDRRKEAFQACSLIFGGSDEDNKPTIQGMIDKVKSDKLSNEIFEFKTSFSCQY